MLPKNLRLTKKRDFEVVIKSGRWFRSQNLSLKVLNLNTNSQVKLLDNNLKKPLKIAVSVGIKFSKKAVERNKIRRQIFEATRLALQGKKLPSGYFLMFVPTNIKGQPKKEENKINKIKSNKPIGNLKKGNNYEGVNFANLSQEVKLLLINSGVSHD